MEAFAALLAALMEAVCQLMLAVAELLAALLELLLELLFVLVTQGYHAARERYGRRKAERRAARETAQKVRADDDVNPAGNTTGTARLIVTGIVLVVMGTAGVTFYVQHQLRRQRIEETQLRLAALADDVSQKVRNDAQPPPESGRLADRDAWNRQFELSLQEGILGTRIIVRSDGPDGQSGTLDDLQAGRYVNHSVKDVAGEIAQRGLNKLKAKATRFLPGQDESDDNSGEPQ